MRIVVGIIVILGAAGLAFALTRKGGSELPPGVEPPPIIPAPSPGNCPAGYVWVPDITYGEWVCKNGACSRINIQPHCKRIGS